MFFYDSTYILIVLGAIITMAAQGKLKSTYSRYARMRSSRGLTGREAAEQILRMEGLSHVQVRRVGGQLTDHYDPRTQTVNLSDATYQQTSVAAIGVAAHECGHALQHARGYVPLSLRSALVPVANLGSMAAMPLIFIGLFISGEASALVINLGILAFLASILFQVVTLPVEFNASRRAVGLLDQLGILSQQELGPTKSVLRAAALTYVAAVGASLLQLLRLLLLTRNRRD